MDLVSIGKRIKAERQKNGLTQEALAERIEVSAHYVYELERGLKAMSVPILIRISEVLHTSTDYLLFGEASGPQAMDRLATLTRNISPEKRDLLADIFTLMLPMLKNDEHKTKKRPRKSCRAQPFRGRLKRIRLFCHTLNRNSTTSPSCITYSLPSLRTRPFSFAAAIEPLAIRSS